MEETILVKAGKGRRVLTPRGQSVPSGTFRINKSDPYWARALRSEDLVITASNRTSESDTDKPVNTQSIKEDK